MKTIPMKLFYVVGAILFLVGALGSIYNLVVVWDKLNIGAIVASISNIIFNLIIVVTFVWLYKLTPSANAQVPTDDDFENLLDIKPKKKKKEGKSKNDNQRSAGKV